MLKKLMKYDLKWVYKVLVIFYLLSILFSVLGRVLVSIENSTILNIIGQVCIGIAIAMIINALVNNLIRIWVRFIRNVYHDESYLTHTLPVHKKTIFLSKFLSAIITMFTTVLVILLCLAICYYSASTMEILKTSLEMVASLYDSTTIVLLSILFFLFFLEMTLALVSGYLGIILGHKSNNNRMLKSVVYGLLIYLLGQICIVGLLFMIAFSNQEILNLFITNKSVEFSSIKTILYTGIAFYLICIPLYYKIGEIQLRKGVNVD